jgi:hypothetical protein
MFDCRADAGQHRVDSRCHVLRHRHPPMKRAAAGRALIDELSQTQRELLRRISNLRRCVPKDALRFGVASDLGNPSRHLDQL